MKTKDLLSEWKSFLTETAVVSLSRLRQQMTNSASYDQNDIDVLNDFWNNNNYASKYSQIISKEIEKGEPIHFILDTVSSHYFKIYQSAGPVLKSKISQGNLSLDELIDSLENRKSFNKNEIRQQCSYKNGRPVVGSYQDFDVIYSENDWIVIEPKTTFGSISWTHGKPDGSEEKDQSRRSDWCTGTETVDNMFYSYAGNLHMFYVINSNYVNDKSVNRRLCLSFFISEHNPTIKTEGGSTVNADNAPINSDYIEMIKNENYYPKIIQALKGRKNTSFKEIYEKTSASQFIRLYRQMNIQSLDKKNIYKEIKGYLKNSFEKEKIAVVLSYDKDEKVKEIVAASMKLPEDMLGRLFKSGNENTRLFICHDPRITEKTLKVIAQEGSEYNKQTIINSANMTASVLSILSRDPSKLIRASAAVHNLVSIEDLERLALDPEKEVLLAVTSNKNAPEKTFLKLAKSSDESIVTRIAANENSPDSALSYLTKKAIDSNNKNLKIAIAKNKSASPEILYDLWLCNDESIDYELVVNPNTIKDVVNSIIENYNDYDDLYFFSRYTTNKHALIYLAKNSNYDRIKLNIIKKKTCPVEALQMLSKDDDVNIRFNVLLSDNVTKEIVESMLNDENIRISNTAQQILEDKFKNSSIKENLIKQYIRLMMS